VSRSEYRQLSSFSLKDSLPPVQMGRFFVTKSDFFDVACRSLLPKFPPECAEGRCQKSARQGLRRDLASHHSPPMNSKRRGEPWAAELPDDVDDPRIVVSLPDEPT
jgi:hypothetical protein